MNSTSVIKSIHLAKFTVELLQDKDGRYAVRFVTGNDPEEFTNWTTDYLLASYMFDLKIRDLEGN